MTPLPAAVIKMETGRRPPAPVLLPRDGEAAGEARRAGRGTKCVQLPGGGSRNPAAPPPAVCTHRFRAHPGFLASQVPASRADPAA